MAVKKKPKAKAKPSTKSRRNDLLRQERAEELRLTGLIDSAAGERYGGSERVLTQQVAQRGAHTATIDNAYKLYQQQVAELAVHHQQQMAQAAQAQAGVAQGVAAGQANLGAGQAQQSQETAARYGLDGGAQAAEATKLAGQLGAVQGAGLQAQAGTTAAIGLAQGARLSAASLAGIGGQQRDRARNQSEIDMLGQKRLDLESDKGAFKVGLRDKIKTDESDRRLAEAALNIKSADSARDAELELLGLRLRDEDSERDASQRERDSQRDATLKREDLAAKREQNAIENRRSDRKFKLDFDKEVTRSAQRDRELDIQAKKAGGGGAVNLTPAKKNEWRQKKARIIELRKAFLSGKDTGRSTEQMSVYLKKQGYKRVEINMARDLAVTGRLSAPNMTAGESYFPGGYIPGGFRAG